jgi:hypothetical protein
VSGGILLGYLFMAKRRVWDVFYWWSQDVPFVAFLLLWGAVTIEELFESVTLIAVQRPSV